MGWKELGPGTLEFGGESTANATRSRASCSRILMELIVGVVVVVQVTLSLSLAMASLMRRNSHD